MGTGKKILAIVFIALFGGLILFAQSKPENFKDKLKKIKKGEKVVVSTPDGEVVFEGKDAEKLLKRFGAGGMSWVMETDGDGEEEFIFISSDGDTNMTSVMSKVFVTSDDDEAFNISFGDENRELTIKDEDGEKYVKDVFYENGDKKVVELRGKEAEEYLDKLEDIGTMHKVDVDGDIQFFGIDGNFGEGASEIEIEIEDEDGTKKVTVTTEDEDGEKTTRVYEGDEADEFLEKHGHNQKAMFFKSGKGPHKFEFFFDEDSDSMGDSMKVKIKKLMKGKTKVIIMDEDDD